MTNDDLTTKAAEPTPAPVRHSEPGSAPPTSAGTPIRTPRSAALEAGRWFHRARVLTHELVLSGRATAARRLTADILPALVAAGGEMHPPAAGAAERVLVPWFGGAAARLDGADHAERLQDEQRALDALTGWEREEYDLGAHRARLLGGTQAELDGLRGELLAGVPDGIAAAFRLGELLEAGAYPIAVSLPAVAEPPPDVVPVFGAPAAPDRRLVLAEPAARAYDRPWPAWWPAWTRAAWAGCGLSEGDESLPNDSAAPAAVDTRERIVEALAARAAVCFEMLDHPALTLADRFRVVDEGACVVCLDGQPIHITDRRAFFIVRGLLRASGHEMSAAELMKLPGCDTDISKTLKKLPPELREVVRSRTGPSAVYYLQLPPRRSGGG